MSSKRFSQVAEFKGTELSTACFDEAESRIQRILYNQDFTSKLLHALPEKAIKQAKMGHRWLELTSLIEDDVLSDTICSGSITDPAVFRYGSVAYFLCDLLLRAGFKVDLQNEENVEEVLVMSW